MRLHGADHDLMTFCGIEMTHPKLIVGTTRLLPFCKPHMLGMVAVLLLKGAPSRENDLYPMLSNTSCNSSVSCLPVLNAT